MASASPTGMCEVLQEQIHVQVPLMLTVQTDVINTAVKGNVALVRRGTCALQTKFDNVLAVGAHVRSRTGYCCGIRANISLQKMLHMLLTKDAWDTIINTSSCWLRQSCCRIIVRTILCTS